LDHEIVAYEIVVVAFAFVVVAAVVAWSLYVLVLASWDLAFQDEVDLRVVVVVALQNAVVVLEVVLEAEAVVEAVVVDLVVVYFEVPKSVVVKVLEVDLHLDLVLVDLALVDPVVAVAFAAFVVERLVLHVEPWLVVVDHCSWPSLVSSSLVVVEAAEAVVAYDWQVLGEGWELVLVALASPSSFDHLDLEPLQVVLDSWQSFFVVVAFAFLDWEQIEVESGRPQL
jgi:hypothetical protein